MKPIFSFFICMSICTTIFSQEKYPVPEETSTRLFYIQHSKNHNTYVYDAKMKGDSISLENPINEYRIVYTEGGEKKPLNKIQKQFAYGMVTNNCKLYLDSIFVELEENTSSIKAKAKYVLFSGKDFTSGKNVTQKLIVE